MAEHQVTHVYVVYRDAEGNQQTAVRGDKITVHKDDVERLEKAGAIDKPKSDK